LLRLQRHGHFSIFLRDGFLNAEREAFRSGHSVPAVVGRSVPRPLDSHRQGKGQGEDAKCRAQRGLAVKHPGQEVQQIPRLSRPQTSQEKEEHDAPGKEEITNAHFFSLLGSCAQRSFAIHLGPAVLPVGTQSAADCLPALGSLARSRPCPSHSAAKVLPGASPTVPERP